MGFFKSLERKVFRPVGRGLKAAAPVIGGVAGSFIPGVGNIVGSAIGSAIGGQVKRGKFDAGSLLKDAGTGVLTGGVMNKLGGGSFLSGAKPNAAGGVGGFLEDYGSGAVGNMAGGAPQAASGGIRSAIGNALKDGKTIKAIGDTAIGGLQAVNANRQMQMERDQINRRNRLEDEALARQRGLDPMRAQLLQAMFQRLGLGGGVA